jgi:hypothetical protein
MGLISLSRSVSSKAILSRAFVTTTEARMSESNGNTKRTNSSTMLRAKEAATLIGIGPKTLANWRWRGLGPPFIKLPGKGGKGAVRYDRDTVLKWLDDRTRCSTTDTGNAGGRE